MNKPRTYNLNDILTFGTYNGKTINDVIEINAQYLLWAIDEGIIDVSDELLVTIQKEARNQHADPSHREY